jgi:hypothetical protein
MPAPAPAPHVPSAVAEPEPIADPPTRVTRTRDASSGSTRPQRSPLVEPVRAEPAMPLGFEELPAHDERYQGQIYGPSKPGPDTVPAEGPDDGHQDADEPAPENPGTAGSNPEPPLETTSPAKKSEPSSIEPEGFDRPAVPVAGTAGNIYDAANPDLAALLSRLSGSYHSDRAQGTYRSPRIDNKGPRPAMVINGQVLHNLVLDCGADAVLVGPKTAARLQLKPDMIRENAIRIRVASGSTIFMDETIKPIDFVLNPGMRDETTVWAKIVIVHGDLPNTLIGMSVMGPASIYPNPHKGTVKYYVNWWEPNARKAYLRCHMRIDLPTRGRPGARSARLSVAFSANTESARLLQIPTPKNAFDVDNARFRMLHFEGKLVKEMTELYELSKSKLEAAPPPPRPVSEKAYQHLRPLDTSMIDLRGPLSKKGPGLVVLELFSGIMATTEALVRCAVKVRKVYACEIESETREVAQRRLNTLSTIRPEQLSREAIHGAHTHLPQDIRLITRRHIEQMAKPDLVVVGFPCQGFLMASDTPKGLRDPRTALFQEVLRVIHLIWRIHGPCGYLFENLDASDHPVAEVCRDVVQAVLGKGFVLDAVAVGSYAHRNRRWWTNLGPGSLLDEMVDRKFERRSPGQRVQDILEPG